jgi:hypothetical protein
MNSSHDRIPKKESDKMDAPPRTWTMAREIKGRG